jgi:hypothetical protein
VKDYPLATIGRNQTLHSVMPSGQPHCAKRFNGAPHPTSDIRPTGERGKPSCHYCAEVLGVTPAKLPDPRERLGNEAAELMKSLEI